jgi:hypothetical protein
MACLKYLARTNALAYYDTASRTKKKTIVSVALQEENEKIFHLFRNNNAGLVFQNFLQR